MKNYILPVVLSSIISICLTGQNVSFDQLNSNYGTSKHIVFVNNTAGSGFNGCRIYNGNTSTSGRLIFQGAAAGATAVDHMAYTYEGKFGIGEMSPPVRLTVKGQEAPAALGDSEWSAIRICNDYASTFGGRSELQFGLDPSGTGRLGVIAGEYSNHNGGVCGDLVFGTASQAIISENMRINYLGNVLINKTTQTNTAYKLDINGSVRANEIVVNTTGADYVFDWTYKLMDLKSLRRYIEKHKHLPGIAAAKEMQQTGMEVGKLNTKLLEKVEELTLYILELQDRIESLESRIEAK